MEWPEFELSPPHNPLLGFSPPQQEAEHHQQLSEWTREEDKLFENALAEFDDSSPDFFENIASRVPWKSMEDIKKHYQALVEDIEMIESGEVPLPEYEDGSVTTKMEKGSSSKTKKTHSSHQRKKGVPWTEEEHKLFLMGMNSYGKGDWRSISRYYVHSKTPTQVASHAQKYFRRQNNSTPVDRRRPSIHDIQTVNSTFNSFPQRHRNPPNTAQPAPFSLPNNYAHLLPPIYNRQNHNAQQISTGFPLENPVFPPVTSPFPAANPTITTNQSSGASTYPSSSYVLPLAKNAHRG